MKNHTIAQLRLERTSVFEVHGTTSTASFFQSDRGDSANGDEAVSFGKLYALMKAVAAAT